jgi:hypothetical protein
MGGLLCERLARIGSVDADPDTVGRVSRGLAVRSGAALSGSSPAAFAPRPAAAQSVNLHSAAADQADSCRRARLREGLRSGTGLRARFRLRVGPDRLRYPWPSLPWQGTITKGSRGGLSLNPTPSRAPNPLPNLNLRLTLSRPAGGPIEACRRTRANARATAGHSLPRKRSRPCSWRSSAAVADLRSCIRISCSGRA